MNIQFDYRYQDAGGWKNCDSVVFVNPDNIPVDEIRARIQVSLWETEFFIAHQIRIPEIFLYLDGSIDEKVDHCFHHYDSAEETNSAPSDLYQRSIGQFLEEVELQSNRGWQIFDPCQRFATAT
jgi:hypothetical protein